MKFVLLFVSLCHGVVERASIMEENVAVVQKKANANDFAGAVWVDVSRVMTLCRFVGYVEDKRMTPFDPDMFVVRLYIVFNLYYSVKTIILSSECNNNVDAYAILQSDQNFLPSLYLLLKFDGSEWPYEFRENLSNQVRRYEAKKEPVKTWLCVYNGKNDTLKLQKISGNLISFETCVSIICKKSQAQCSDLKRGNKVCLKHSDVCPPKKSFHHAHAVIKNHIWGLTVFCESNVTVVSVIGTSAFAFIYNNLILSSAPRIIGMMSLILFSPIIL